MIKRLICSLSLLVVAVSSLVSHVSLAAPAPLAQTYFPLVTGNSTTIVGDPTNRHNFQPVHTNNITEVNVSIDGAIRKYVAYDSNNEGTQIRVYYTDDLDGQWTSYSGNPILTSASQIYRWPSTAYVSGTFHMFLDNLAAKHTERWTSADGINYTWSENMTQPASNYSGAFVYQNPLDSRWYLYWQLQTGVYPDRVYVRNAADIADLDNAEDYEITEYQWSGTAPPRGAALSVMFWEGKFWGVSEDVNVALWNVWGTVSDNLTSGFTATLNSPIFGEGINDGFACPIALVSPNGEKAYLYVTQLWGGQWVQRTWSIQPRPMVDWLLPDSNGDLQIEGSQPVPPGWQRYETIRQDDAFVSYVYQSAIANPGNRDFYGYQNITATASIESITLYNKFYDPQTGAASIYNTVNSTGSIYEYTSHDAQYINAFRWWNQGAMTVDPATTSAWTQTGVNDLQAGFKIYKGNGVDSGSVTMSRIQVRYLPVAVTTNTPSIVMDKDGVNTIVLNGSLNNLGADTSANVSFNYGLTLSYGSNTTAQNEVATGIFADSINGLTPGQSYHYRAVGRNASRYNYGSDYPFTLTMPTVVTGTRSSNAKGDGAVLRGNITSMGVATSADVFIQWGTTPAYGNNTTAQEVLSIGGFSATINNLETGRVYYYRAVTKVGSVYAYGAGGTFTTAPTGQGSMTLLIMMVVILVGIFGARQIMSIEGLHPIIVIVLVVVGMYLLTVATQGLNTIINNLW